MNHPVCVLRLCFVSVMIPGVVAVKVAGGLQSIFGEGNARPAFNLSVLGSAPIPAMLTAGSCVQSVLRCHRGNCKFY